MKALVIVALLCLTGCAGQAHDSGAVSQPKQSGSRVDRRCLPVVAAECGCVYSCGVGQRRADGRWTVTHSHWGSTPVVARIDRWCADGQCTDAFFGEIVCSGICPRRPADSTCHFEGDRCVGADRPR